MVSRFGSRQRTVWDRFTILFFAAAFIFTVIAGKLFWLQVINGSEYQKLADDQNSRGVILPAKRGDIYARDYRTAELYPLAQNSTTYIIFADPLLIDGEPEVAELLLPLIYIPPEEQSVEEVTAVADPNAELDLETDKPKDNSKQEFKNWLVQRLTTKNVVRREIHIATPEQLELVRDAYLPGIGTDGEIVTVNPTLIDNPEDTATKLATILDANYDDIYPVLLPRKVRYAKLAGRIAADKKTEILALGIRGVGAIPEYRRVYPEGSLAAQIVGFLNHDEVGVYGIEGAKNKTLAGKQGLRRTQVDPFNRQITVGDITIDEAEDGASVVLTIDRTIQEIVERELGKMVDQQRADSGQAIVMDPYTGAILALVHYPTYDPNNYGEVYQNEELVKKEHKISWTDENGEVQTKIENSWETAKGEPLVVEWEREYIVRDGYRFPVFTVGEQKFIYENRLAEGAIALKAITEPYEPGSVFKPIVMAMALDAGEVEPGTHSPYSGPVPLDEYIGQKQIVIKNAEGSYHGRETMTEVIANSSNIGMTFVAQQLGKATFYDYLKKFGFAERTDIEFEGENEGRFENYTQWSESELVTKSFGQGLTVNLLQMAAAYSALANGGLLMKPYIVAEELYPDGRRILTEPETVRRVINPETSATITSILIYSVRQGEAKRARLPGYFIAGKTGTSQTYSSSGRALFGVGTTISGFGGYAPATDPKFVMLVKIDRPRVSEWGGSTAGPVFRNVAEELLKNYFAIPPNSKADN
jgi:stage V sporulation protein D (sporulation-specific penicillin-binding protein)